MNAQEVAAAYRECLFAVAWAELYVCSSPEEGEPSAWGEMMKGGLSPKEVHDHVRQFMFEEIAEDETEYGREAARRAHAQSAHPKFFDYVRGRMGAY